MILIFKSEITNAVYSWNGKETVVIVGAKDRPVGARVNGFDNHYLKSVFLRGHNPPNNNYRYFKVGDATYEIIEAITL